MGESIKRIVSPYQDSYSPNGIIGEKDACGVGFIANIKGVESNWILKQSLKGLNCICLLYTSPSPRDKRQSRMPSSA